MFISCSKKSDYYRMDKNNKSIVENIKLSFTMSIDEIEAYYQMIDNLVDKEPSITINLGKVDAKTKEKIVAERSEEGKYFAEDIEFIYDGKNIWSRTPIKPDGYVDFNNYYYREIDIISYQPNKNFLQYAEEGINPLKCFPGYIITNKDIPVYERYYKDVRVSDWIYDKEIPDWESVEWKEVGLLKSGTVIELTGTPTHDYIFVIPMFSLQGCIKVTDIELLEYLLNAVSYKIENEKLYRYIEGQKIEINYLQYESGYYENGYRYIRNPYSNNNLLDKFYFWEILGDYLFDENGDLIDIVEYGPD
jgi:hypothetical protein